MRITRFWIAVAIIVALTALSAVTVVLALNNDTKVEVAESCKPGQTEVDLSMPDDPSKVKLVVLNSTENQGVATYASGDFLSRKFKVIKTTNIKGPYKGVAQIKYGPKRVGAAWILRAYFLNEAELSFNPKEKSDVITVVLGSKFKKLASETEKNQSIAAAGRPQLPPGTCSKD